MPCYLYSFLYAAWNSISLNAGALNRKPIANLIESALSHGYQHSALSYKISIGLRHTIILKSTHTHTHTR